MSLIEKDGINLPMNFNRITERLFVGGRPREFADLTKLHQAGITDILDVCDVDDSLLLPKGVDWRGLGFEYLWNDGGPDNGAPKPAAWFQASIRFAFAALTRPKRILYVHCFNGINRGPSSAYAILRALGWPSLEAKAQLRLLRPLMDVAGGGIGYANDADKAIEVGW